MSAALPGEATLRAPFLPPPNGADEAWREAFRWPQPAFLNIAHEACTRWAEAEPDREALRIVEPNGPGERWSYAALDAASNRIANALGAHGVIARGDRVAVLLPQCAAVPIAHLAVYKLGAVAVPLANLFGPDAVRYRLGHSGAKALVTNAAGLAKLDGRAAPLVVSVDGGDALAWSDLVHEGSDVPVMAETGPADPALMIYTSGTTGSPKGALHGHRVVMGHLPGVATSHGGLPRPGDRFWTPSDWAWAGGLLNVLLSALTLGIPVVGGDIGRFEPRRALDLMRAEDVRNLFLPPTALRMLRDAPREAFAGLKVRSIASGGESLGPETRAWAAETFGAGRDGFEINELYGQTEANYLVASAAGQGVYRPGAIGRAVAGHRLAILDEGGREVPDGEVGEICVASPDPVMFLHYWQDEAATARAFANAPEGADWSDAGSVEGAWLRTGDRGARDADGYITFAGRTDDVITSAGYRIGPSEIEECLIAHPAVALAAVVGVPDALRTEIIRAVIVPAAGVERHRGGAGVDHGACQGTAFRPSRAARDRGARRPAAHDDGQDHPPSAARRGDRGAGGHQRRPSIHLTLSRAS